jgi:uncharacterized protein
MQIDVNNSLNLQIEELIGQRIAVLGISGSGKTNTVAVLAEELLPHVPMTICDIEGEYYGLKERFDLLVAGRSDQAEVPLFRENAASLAEVSIQRGISIILDLSEIELEEMQEILLTYFERLWQLASSLKSPYEIVIEEAHEYIPQGTRTPLKSLLTRFALRGRKRGIGVILASQRSSKVEKDLLTQANILLLHNVVHPIDLGVYKDLIPLSAKEVEQQVRDLEPGSAFLIRGKQVNRLQIRKRSTFHAGATPTLGEHQPHLRMIDASLLEELRAIATQSVKEGGSDELSRLKKQLRDAVVLMEQKDAEIAELKKRLELVSTLRVEMPGQALSLPETMHIERATVGQLHTPVAAPPRIVESAEVSSKTATKPSEPAAVPLNEGKLKALQIWFERKTTPHQRRMLNVLHEQGKSMDAYEIASWSGDAENTIRNQPPLALVQRGMVSRTRVYHKGYRYSSTLSAFLAREFPGTDQQALIERVLSWCR